MIRVPSFNLRARLLVLALVVVGPTMGLILHEAAEDRRREATQLKHHSMQLAHLVAHEEEQMIQGTRQLLVLLGQVPVVRGDDPARCSAYLADLLKHYQRYLNLGIIGVDGEVRSSAVPQIEPLSLADREYFRQAFQTRDFFIGQYQVGRITGKPSLNLAYPILDARGQPQAIVFAALSLDWLGQHQIAFCRHVLPAATITTIDAAGVVLTRHPDRPETVGKLLPERNVRQAIGSQDPGMVQAPGPKGVTVYAFAKVPISIRPGNLAVILDVPRAVLFAEVNRARNRNLAALAICAGLILALGWASSQILVLQPLNALIRTARQIGTGDLSARVSLTPRFAEVGQLARALDQMAESLAKGESERKRAEQVLRELSGRFLRLQDEERRRIAQELHDSTAQKLAAAAMNLSRLKSPAAKLDTGGRAVLADAAGLVAQCSDEIRTMCYLLHPPMLEELGLADAVRDYADGFARRSGLRVDLEIEPDLGRLSKSSELALFRVVQESLGNVHRHSGSHTASIRLRAERSEARLEVADTGCGIPTEILHVLDGQAGGGQLGVGLAGMRERLRQLGGRMDINSSHTGTTIYARVPLTEDPA